jgi:hypothetical protein
VAALMRLLPMSIAVGVVWFGIVALAQLLAPGCGSDLSGRFPAVERRHDLERDALSATLAAEEAAAALACPDVPCQGIVAQTAATVAASQLGNLADRQRAELIEACRQAAR